MCSTANEFNVDKNLMIGFLWISSEDNNYLKLFISGNYVLEISVHERITALWLYSDKEMALLQVNPLWIRISWKNLGFWSISNQEQFLNVYIMTQHIVWSFLMMFQYGFGAIHSIKWLKSAIIFLFMLKTGKRYENVIIYWCVHTRCVNTINWVSQYNSIIRLCNIEYLGLVYS